MKVGGGEKVGGAEIGLVLEMEGISRVRGTEASAETRKGYAERGTRPWQLRVRQVVNRQRWRGEERRYLTWREEERRGEERRGNAVVCRVCRTVSRAA